MTAVGVKADGNVPSPLWTTPSTVTSTLQTPLAERVVKGRLRWERDKHWKEK